MTAQIAQEGACWQNQPLVPSRQTAPVRVLFSQNHVPQKETLNTLSCHELTIGTYTTGGHPGGGDAAVRMTPASERTRVSTRFPLDETGRDCFTDDPDDVPGDAEFPIDGALDCADATDAALDAPAATRAAVARRARTTNPATFLNIQPLLWIARYDPLER